MANPHLTIDQLHVGANLDVCRTAVVAVHGRGQSAAYMLEHVVSRVRAADAAWLLPQAEGNTWYPMGFLAPLADNQPRLDQALEVLDRTQQQLADAGIPPERTVWLGFSQGACLVTEWVARHPARWGGLVAFTGGYIGPRGDTRTIDGSLDGMPAYFGVGSHDEWVPLDRVQESAAAYIAAGAQVSLEVFPGRPHEISGREIEAAQRIVRDTAG